MPAFTPGPWVIEDYGVGIFSRSGDCSIVDLAEANSDKEKIANARLIAAAPELYEAVCDLLDYAYEALHWAGGENEIHGKAPRILRDIQEYQELLVRIDGSEEHAHDTDA